MRRTICGGVQASTRSPERAGLSSKGEEASRNGCEGLHGRWLFGATVGPERSGFGAHPRMRAWWEAEDGRRGLRADSSEACLRSILSRCSLPSRVPRCRERLSQSPTHCVEVADCAEAIVDATGSQLAVFFGLDDTDEARLGSLLRIAALIHDVGKAGGSFQRQMQEDVREIHPFRHEALSVAVCMEPNGLGSWIGHMLPDTRARAAVLTAVMGHHVRASPSAPEARTPRDEVVYLDHPSLSRLDPSPPFTTNIATLPSTLNSLLKQAVEQQAASPGCASVEAKGELVQIVGEVFAGDPSLEGSEDPALEERRHPMYGRHEHVRGIAGGREVRDRVAESPVWRVPDSWTTRSATSRLPGAAPSCSSSSSTGATSTLRPCSPPTRASSSGERPCTTRSWPPRCSTAAPQNATSSTSAATATGCDVTRHSPRPSTRPPPGPSPRSTRRSGEQRHDGCPDSIGSPRSGRSAPFARAPPKCALFNGQSGVNPTKWTQRGRWIDLP